MSEGPWYEAENCPWKCAPHIPSCVCRIRQARQAHLDAEIRELMQRAEPQRAQPARFEGIQ